MPRRRRATAVAVLRPRPPARASKGPVWTPVGSECDEHRVATGGPSVHAHRHHEQGGPLRSDPAPHEAGHAAVDSAVAHRAVRPPETVQGPASSQQSLPMRSVAVAAVALAAPVRSAFLRRTSARKKLPNPVVGFAARRTTRAMPPKVPAPSR